MEFQQSSTIVIDLHFAWDTQTSRFHDWFRTLFSFLIYYCVWEKCSCNYASCCAVTKLLKLRKSHTFETLLTVRVGHFSSTHRLLMHAFLFWYTEHMFMLLLHFDLIKFLILNCTQFLIFTPEKRLFWNKCNLSISDPMFVGKKLFVFVYATLFSKFVQTLFEHI